MTKALLDDNARLRRQIIALNKRFERRQETIERVRAVLMKADCVCDMPNPKTLCLRCRAFAALAGA